VLVDPDSESVAAELPDVAAEPVLGVPLFPRGMAGWKPSVALP
jgi:hypothetical protein